MLSFLHYPFHISSWDLSTASGRLYQHLCMYKSLLAWTLWGLINNLFRPSLSSENLVCITSQHAVEHFLFVTFVIFFIISKQKVFERLCVMSVLFPVLCSDDYYTSASCSSEVINDVSSWAGFNIAEQTVRYLACHILITTACRNVWYRIVSLHWTLIQNGELDLNSNRLW